MEQGTGFSYWRTTGYGIGQRTAALFAVALLISPAPVRANEPVAIGFQILDTYVQQLAEYLPSFAIAYQRCAQLYQQGQYSRALSEIDTLLRKTPDNSACHRLRAAILMAQGRYALALNDLDLTASLEPDKTEIRLERGLTLMHLMRYADAIPDFQAVLTDDNDHYDAYRYRALCYYYLHDYKRAADDYRECIRIRPGEASAYRNRALTLLRAQDYKDALDCWNVYIGFNPTDVEAYFNRGMAYSSLQKYDRAIIDLQKYVAVRPNDANAWYQLALCFMSRADREWERAEDGKAGPDYERAASGFNEATRQRREDAIAYFNLGQAYIKLAKVTEDETPYQAARVALERFLQLAPDDKDAPAVRNQIAQIASRLGVP